jgi:hypothetical protein
MATPKEFVACLHDALGVPLSVLGTHETMLRGAGLLTKAGRGHNVTRRTAMDAARFLISLLATESTTRAAEAAQDFGHLLCWDWPDRMGVAKPLAGTLQKPHTLETAVAAILEGLGDDELLRRLGRGKTLFAMVKVKSVTMAAEIVIGDATFTYHHAGLAEARMADREARTATAGTPEHLAALEAATAALERHLAAAARYRGVRTERYALLPELAPIASCILGKPVLLDLPPPIGRAS